VMDEKEEEEDEKRDTKTIATLDWNGIVIQSRESDKYINATQLCKAGGKLFNDWGRLDKSKALLESLSVSLQICIEDLSRYESGNNQTRSTWVHPDLAIQIAQWVSPVFAVKVSKWVTQWRYISPQNDSEFLDALLSITPSQSASLEKYFNDKYKILLQAENEVTTPVGKIDLLTHDKIIEIKTASDWKHAIGQVLCYGVFYPSHEKWIYLFSHDDLKEDIKNCIGMICSKHEIKHKYI
jgi:hypothetical protein